jgi:hypothetical protein
MNLDVDQTLCKHRKKQFGNRIFLLPYVSRVLGICYGIVSRAWLRTVPEQWACQWITLQGTTSPNDPETGEMRTEFVSE